MTQRKNSRSFNAARKRFFSECKAGLKPCWLCGLGIDYTVRPGSSDESFNLDHEFPVSKRPDLQFDPAGFRPSHRICNILRGDKDPKASLGTLTRAWIDTNAAVSMQASE